MRLVYKETGKEVQVGDVVVTRDGEHCIVTDVQKPRHAGSSGRIYFQEANFGYSGSYYPSVFGAEWIEREDREED